MNDCSDLSDFVDNPLSLRCVEVVELVTHYLDDALDVHSRSAVEAHLAGCSGCTQFVVQIETTIRLTAALGRRGEPQKPPANLAELSASIVARRVSREL